MSFLFWTHHLYVQNIIDEISLKMRHEPELHLAVSAETIRRISEVYPKYTHQGVVRDFGPLIDSGRQRWLPSC